MCKIKETFYFVAAAHCLYYNELQDEKKYLAAAGKYNSSLAVQEVGEQWFQVLSQCA